MPLVRSNSATLFFMDAFKKPALSYTEQLDQLKSRGMKVEDDDQAILYLQHCNYYRLSGYFYQFYVSDKHNEFSEDASFQYIIDASRADRNLRPFNE